MTAQVKQDSLNRSYAGSLSYLLDPSEQMDMGQGSGVISLHGRFRAHGHTIRTALLACGIRLGLINRG